MLLKSTLKRIAASAAALVLSAGVLGAVIDLSAAQPAGATTNGTTTYEYDCTTTLEPGAVAPFGVTADLDTSTDSVTLPNATFGATGELSYTLVGQFVAAFASEGVLTSSGVALNVTDQTIASTDGSATGSYSFSGAWTGRQPTESTLTATFASGATSISVTSGTPVVGDGLEGPGLTAEGVTIEAVSGSAGAYTVVISAATTAAETGASETQFGSMTFTTDGASGDPAPISTGNVFTTASPPLYNGGQANIGLTTLSGIQVVVALPIQFGASSGGAGYGTSNCLETGWQNATTPGPSQDGETSPAYPYGETTPLVLASGGAISQPNESTDITPPAAAYATAVSTAPTPLNQTVSLGEGDSGSVTLTATAGSFPVGSFTLVTASPVGSLTFSQVSPGSATVDLSNDATAPETDTFQFEACDNEPTPVCSTTPGTITVDIGTPPVIQPFSEQVNAGALVLSCDSPSTYVTNASLPVPSPTNSPLLQCPEFQFPSVTLNGLEQVVTATTAGNTTGSTPGTIYISDNRGSPTDSWTLTGTLVPTAIGSGNGENSNSSCSGVDAFCNESVGAAALNTATNGAHDGQIAPKYLQVSSITCTADATGGTTGPDGTVYNPPNLNPDATPTSGGNFGGAAGVTLCSASVGQSGGTFLYNATYTLTIPESVYAGNYIGSVQFTIA